MTIATYQALLGAPRIKRSTSWLRKHSFIFIALSILIVGGIGIKIGSRYFSRDINLASSSILTAHETTLSGLNSSVKNDQLAAQLQSISSQPATLNLGTKIVPISPNTIKSWLKVTNGKGSDGIHVSAKTINDSLNQVIDQYTFSPRNEVVSSVEGSPRTIYGGTNGAQLSPTANISGQSQELAKNLLGGKGFQVNAPLVSVPFASVTPAAFPKLLEADITTKTLYAFQNGQLVNTFLSSDGAPATPTPIGEFHIYAKFTSQDMSGLNPNGTKYFQPHVPWVNYFYSGSAVHGVYWHPLSWFGAINSSHGCVGLPVDEAQWVFNWAPIGTTVITHT